MKFPMPVVWLLIAILLVVSIGFAGMFFETRTENELLRDVLSGRESEVLSTTEAIVEPPVVEIVTDSLISRVAARAIEFEGVKTFVYDDGKGNGTIGVGRNLAGNGVSIAELESIVGELDYGLLLKETHIENGRVRIKSIELAKRIFVKPLTKVDIHLLLLDDLRATQNDALTVFGSDLWGKIGEVRKEALLDTIFALGLPHFQEFVNLIKAVRVGNWNNAASELLKSEAANEAPERFFRNYYILKNNKYLEVSE